MITLNQFVNTLKTLAEGHRQVEEFGYGELSELSPSSRTYPLVWTTTENPSLQGNQLTMRFSVYFLDRVQHDRTNEQELSSDQLLTALDIIAQLKSPAYYDDFTLEQNGNFEHIVDGEDDKLVGWKVDLSVRVDYVYDRCQVPSTVTPSRITPACDPVTIYGTDGLTVLSSVSSGGSYVQPQIVVTDVLGNPITYDYSTAITSTAYSAITAQQHEDNLSVVKRQSLNYLGYLRTGQTASTVSGDDAHYQKGRGAAWGTLSTNNVFVNLLRLTDTLGGVNWAGNGNLILDHQTKLMWYRLSIGSNLAWATAVSTAEGSSQGGYTDWRLPNKKELDSIVNDGASNINNPFNFLNGGGYWTSTHDMPGWTNYAIHASVNAGSIQFLFDLKANSANHFALMCRDFDPNDF